MVHQAAKIIEALALAGAASSIAYYALCLWSASRFLRERKAAGEGARPTQAVSLLKPLRRTDPEMYEIIFGVSDASDPAIQLVEQLKSEFPQRSIRLIVCHENLGANTKVSNLAQ